MGWTFLLVNERWDGGTGGVGGGTKYHCGSRSYTLAAHSLSTFDVHRTLNGYTVCGFSSESSFGVTRSPAAAEFTNGNGADHPELPPTALASATLAGQTFGKHEDT